MQHIDSRPAQAWVKSYLGQAICRDGDLSDIIHHLKDILLIILNLLHQHSMRDSGTYTDQ